jgi:predicted PurR-regulated permease PerM
MALPAKQQTVYWGIFAVVFLVALWFLGDVLLPFIVGGAIAYGLDPLADRLERRGLSRAAATTVITLFALFVFVVLVLLVIPLLVDQTQALVAFIPDFFAQARAFLTERFPQIFDTESTVGQALTAMREALQARSGELARQIASSLAGVINAVVFIVVVPVVAFYLLLDWDRMVAQIDDLLPRDHAPTVRRLAAEVDRTLASFVRGQLTVCAILGAFYAIGLMIVGLQFGLVVGAIAGLISFIPYIGALVGGALALGLALFQFWNDPIWIGAVAAIFAAGQMLEGNVLTPKLVGGSVGLHPVWLLLALSAFGAIYGFVGMLVAVPVAAMIGVLARFLIAEYKSGLLYRGLDGNRDDAAE